MSAPEEQITPAQCEICRALRDVETSFHKFGWEEQDRPLPAAAFRLAPAEPTDTYERQIDHIERCPLCGTLYHYRWSYEYLSNGSEDEEVLTRLTPAQVEAFLTRHERP